MGDDIKAPKHYIGRGGIEPLPFIVSNGLTFAEGSVIKYVMRYPLKGTPEADLRKAIFYLHTLLEEVQRNGQKSESENAQA